MSRYLVVPALLLAACGSPARADVPSAPSANGVIDGPAIATETAARSVRVDASGLPVEPFAADSIWRRRVDPNARYDSVRDVLGRPEQAATTIGLDLVTLCRTDPGAPEVPIERSAGWSPAARATSTGQVLYTRRLAADACTDVSWNPVGNALFVLYDAASRTADLGVGGWRSVGGPLLVTAPDGRDAHGLDVFTGDGIVGFGRASGLPALGGLLRAGELANGIPHAVAVNLSGNALSSTTHWVWPARSADGTAAIAYHGSNPALAMGSLLAIPMSVSVGALPWRTTAGRHLAEAAQAFGWYVVDSHRVDGLVQFGMDTTAARRDLGMTIDPIDGHPSYDPALVDAAGLLADVTRIVELLAVVPPPA